MQMQQKSFKLKKQERGFHVITHEVLRHLPEISHYKVGLLHLFIQHTSASLALNESVEPEVLNDMEAFFSDSVDAKPYYRHTYEGDDDMPGHVKNVLIGASITIPITNGRLNLGTWQGIYLCEHRFHAGARSLIATLSGEG